MAGNPPGSDWRSPDNASRKRKMVTFTLSPAAIEALAELAQNRGISRSAALEALIVAAVFMDAPETPP